MPMCDPPAEVNAADFVDGERHDVFDVALHEPLEAVADADDLDALERARMVGGADDAVDAGSGTSAHEDGDLVLCHARPPESSEAASAPEIVRVEHT